MNTTGTRLALCLLLLTMVAVCWGSFFAESTHAQDTGSLEAECVVLASASSIIVPETLTSQEFCKVIVAVLGQAWMNAAKLEGTILLANDNAARLTAAEAEIVVLKTQTSLQPQIDAINAKLLGVANALQ